MPWEQAKRYILRSMARFWQSGTTNFGVRGGSMTAHPNHTPQQCVMAMCVVRRACAVAVHATRWECHVVHLHIVNAQLCATYTTLRRECAEITHRT